MFQYQNSEIKVPQDPMKLLVPKYSNFAILKYCGSQNVLIWQVEKFIFKSQYNDAAYATHLVLSINL